MKRLLWKNQTKLNNASIEANADMIKAEVIRAARLTEIGKFEDTDVFIVGFPRSGHTWFQCLAAGIMYGVDNGKAPYELIQNLVPDVHAKQYYTRVGIPMFFKSHFTPQPEYKRVIYLLRDGRDAMVSYFHFLNAVHPNPDRDFRSMVSSGTELFPCKWHEHVEQWLKNPYNAQIFTIRYEELLAKPVEILKACWDYFGIERDAPYLERVVGQASFSKMKLREAQEGWGKPEFPANQGLIRRGVVGSYKEEMPPEVLKEFLLQAGDTLRKVGYLTS